MYDMLKVDQGSFKEGTMFVESVMSDNDDDNELNEHHLITSNVVSGRCNALSSEEILQGT